MRLIIAGEATQAQIGAFLIAQRIKGEAESEIRGFTHLMRSESIRRITPRVENLLDLGLPYDGKVKTAQLIPAVAVILAVCGVPVVLHGDEGVPAKRGITAGAVLRALGVPADLPPERVSTMIETVGFGYLSAPEFAPEWHALIPLRCEFGLRTALNSVEKLFNPADAPYQISGFFHGEYLERLRQAQTGTRASWIVQGEEGSIEMASGRATHIFAAEESADWVLDPASVGLPARERLTLPPDLVLHAAMNAAVLAGQATPAADQALLTAGAILTLLQLSTDLTDGLRRARRALDSGAAQARLDQARAFRG
jgi:anthranilate phosphoribosyltransferase